MLPAITLLLVYQTIGEILAHTLDLPVPGPVIGMLLLLLTLAVRGGTPDNLRDTASTLLTHFSLLFVPAGVGVMVHLGRLRSEALPIAVSLVVSTALTVAVSAWVLNRLKRKK
jgi:putative effector of murein hydrolase LrgA (UPF0299 family)